MCRADYGDGGPVFCQTTLIVARKVHTCKECHRQIAVGERYQRTSGLWDRGSRPKRFTTCVHCSVLQDWLGAECGGWIYGEVIDDVREHLQEYGVPAYGFALARLVVHAQNNWRRRDGALLPIPDAPPTTFDRRKATAA